MIDFDSLNEEDKKIWKSLESFEFQNATDEDDLSKLRFDLFKSILHSIGKCSRCTAYIPDKSFCSVLKTSTGRNERCSDFEAVEEEEETAFDIMTEEYQEKERIKFTEPNILKYKRNKKKEIELGGDYA